MLAGLAGVKSDQATRWHKARDLRVLIVNHRAFLRRMQADMLALSGILHIDQRTGGIAAVEAPADDIGLVLCGYDMPHGDGLWLLKKIRLGETAYRSDVPFIFVTDAAERWLISSAMNLDADGYVLLPASRSKIEAVVNLALSRARPSRDKDEYAGTSIEPPEGYDYSPEDQEELAFHTQVSIPEPEPAPEPIAQQEPEQQLPECFGKVAKGSVLLLLKELEPEMILGADLLSEKGAILLPSGAVLSEASVRRLRSVAPSFGFNHVPILKQTDVNGD